MGCNFYKIKLLFKNIKNTETITTTLYKETNLKNLIENKDQTIMDSTELKSRQSSF